MTSPYLAVVVLALISAVVGQPQLTILNPALMVEDASRAVIYSNGQLNYIYNDTIYNTALNCRSGDL